MDNILLFNGELKEKLLFEENSEYNQVTTYSVFY